MNIRNKLIVLCSLAGIALAIVAPGQKLTVRNAHSMIYDSKNKRTLLFGGADEKKVYGDLWVLKKKRWKRLKDTGPKPRTFGSMVYDSGNQRIILFGGNSVLFGSEQNPAEFYNDTWEFKKGRWAKINSANSPPQRSAAAVVYDKTLERIVLFGGYAEERGKSKRFGDTWEFKNDRWKKIAETGPSPRVGAVMVFESKLNRIVLYGGSTVDKQYGENSGETWVLKKRGWKKLQIEQPPNIFDSNMIFDQNLKSIFRFGGWDGKGRTNDTLVFSENIWKKLDLKIKPAARNHASMVYDSRRKRTILFGGHNGEEIFGDLWIFKQGKWYKEFEHTPIKRINNGH